MDDYDNLCHSVWECKYHVVFIPKYRKKALYGEIRKRMGEMFRALAKQKECELSKPDCHGGVAQVVRSRGRSPVFSLSVAGLRT